MKYFKKRAIVSSLILATLTCNLGVYASLVDEDERDCFKDNKIRILEIGVDEGDRKLAYLLGDNDATNLDYDRLLQNPDDLRKYRELVGNFELTGGTDVAIDYTANIPAETPEEDIIQQNGYLEKSEDSSDFDYVTEFYTSENLSNEAVFLEDLQIGVISDFDYGHKYRKEIVTNIYQESATGSIIKIGDNYYDLNADFCKIYKDSSRSDEYVLSEITVDDNVIVTIYDHTVYEGVWSGLTKYTTIDCYMEDANGDYVCLDNIGYTLLSDYEKKSIVRISEDNKDSLASDNVVIYRGSNQVYKGSWGSLEKNIEDGITYLYINNMWYSLTDINAYCIFNYSSAYPDIVLIKDNNIVYKGAEASLTRYKENFDNIYKPDENGSYIKFNNIFYNLEDLYCKFTINSEEVIMPLSLYKATDTYGYFTYIANISNDVNIINDLKPDLYMRWKFVPAVSGRYYNFDLDMCDWYSEGEVQTDAYEIWENLEDTKQYRGADTKIKYTRPVILAENVHTHTSDLHLSLKNMIYKTDSNDKFAWIDDDVEIQYEFYTYSEMTKDIMVNASQSGIRNIVYLDTRQNELHDLYEKYSNNTFERKEVNTDSFTLTKGTIQNLLGKYKGNCYVRKNNLKNNTIVCFDGGFGSINETSRLTSLQYAYFVVTAGFPRVFNRYELLNDCKDGFVVNDLMNKLCVKLECSADEFKKYAINNLDGNPFAGHYAMNFSANDSIATLSDVPNDDLSRDIYEYANVDSLTYRDAMGIMLNTIPDSSLGDETIRILEIEPSTSFIGNINYSNEAEVTPYNDNNTDYWYARIFGLDPNFSGSVEVTRMSVNELIASNKNLYDNYDIVYIGSKYNNFTHEDFPYKNEDDETINETYNMFLYSKNANVYPCNSKNSHFVDYKEFGFVGDVDSIRHPNSDVNLLGHKEKWVVAKKNYDGTKFFYWDDTMPSDKVKRLDGLNDNLYTVTEVYVSYNWIYYNSDGILFNNESTNRYSEFPSIPYILNSNECYLNCSFSSYQGDNKQVYYGINKEGVLELGRYFRKAYTNPYNGVYELLDYDESIINAEILSSGKFLHVSVVNPVNAFTTKIKVRVEEELVDRTPNLIKLRHNPDNSPLLVADGKYDLSNTVVEDVPFDSENYQIIDNKLYSNDDLNNTLGLVLSQKYTEEREVVIKYRGDNRGIINNDIKITTKYNDSSMDGKLYTHLGDSYIVGGSAKALFNYRGITNRTEDLFDSEKGLVYKEFNKTRFSGSDLTKAKYNELSNYLSGGKPIILSSKFYNSNGNLDLNTLDANSYMYKLLTNNNVKEDFDLSVNDVLSSVNNNFTLKVLDQPRRYMDTSKEDTRWGVYLPESGDVDEFDLWYVDIWEEYSRDVFTGKLTSINLPSNIVIPQGTRKLRFNSDSDLFNFTLIWVNRVADSASYSGTRINDVNLIHNSNEDGTINIPKDEYHKSYNDYYADGFSLVISLRDPNNSPGDTLEDWMKAIKESNTSICTGDTLKKGVHFADYNTELGGDNVFIPYSELGIENAPETDEEKQDLFYIHDRELSIRFSIEAKEGIYSSNLFMDEISDGRFTNAEEVTNINITDSNGRNISSNNLVPNTEYILYFTLNDNVVGINHWQLKITKNDNDKVYSAYDSYFAIKDESSETKEPIKILQILPSTESINNTNTSTSDFVNFDLTRDNDFINYCKSLEDFNIVVVSATENSDNTYYKLKTASGVLGDKTLIPSENSGLLPKLENCNYHGTINGAEEDAISKEWCTYFYSLFGQEYTKERGMHISDFDMIVFGFANDKVYIKSSTLMSTIDDFIHSGGHVVVSNDIINYNNDNSSKTMLSRYFRTILGQDRFGVSYVASSGILNSNENNDYFNNVTLEKINTFTNLMTPKGFDYCANTKSKTFEGIEGLSDGFILSCQNINSDSGKSQNKIYNETIYNDKDTYSADLLSNINKVACNNRGQINNYPFFIPESIKIAPTHNPYYQLSLDDSLSVWYSLDCSNSINNIDDSTDASYMNTAFNQVRGIDGRNNYYIYTKENITYTGLGNSKNITKDEKKLFINTLIMSYDKKAKSPDLYINNENAMTSGDTTYIYLDSDISDTSKVLDSEYVEKDGNKSLIISCKIDDKNIIVNKDNYVQLRMLNDDGEYTNVPAKIYSIYNSDIGLDSNNELKKASSNVINSIPTNILDEEQSSGIYVLGDKSKFFIEVNLDKLLNCYNTSQTLNKEQSFTLPLECWLYTSYGTANYKTWVSATHNIKLVKRDLFDIK